MKLEKILDNLNSFEKNSFLKIVDKLISENPKNAENVDKILGETNRDLKNIDNINVAKVFRVIEDDFTGYTKVELTNMASQLDIVADIITRDGNCIAKQDWFSRLYENEIEDMEKRIKDFKELLESKSSKFDESKMRDYTIYEECLKTAYYNDLANNMEEKITADEQSILITLSKQLGLSQEEAKLIKYTILPLNKMPIDDLINDMKSVGIIFYSKKTNTVYISDEIVRILRKLRGKEVADKFFRRVLRLLREPQINLVCKRYNIDRKLTKEQKIKAIINAGVSFSTVLTDDIFREGTKATDKKKFINELCDKGLSITPSLKGVTLDEKVSNLINHFEDTERDDKVSISLEGYEKMLLELSETLPQINQQLKDEFELQDENAMKSNYLLDYNIKPRDVLEIVSQPELENFCKAKDIKIRGNLIINILEGYKDVESLYIENFENIGFRDIAALRENGVKIKESELGVKFENLTKVIFRKMGFNVDESLRKKLNTSKDKIDIVLNIGNNDLILIECKTNKDKGYNKFSSVSRQMKSYSKLAEKNSYKVIKSLLVAPDFSDGFIKDCGLDYELNLSLIKASSLAKILEGFKESKHKQFPHNLLMRDVVIQEDMVLKAIDR